MTEFLASYPSGSSHAGARTAVIIAANAAQGRVASQMLAAAGVRELAQIGFGEVGDRLADHSNVDLILIEAGAAPDALLDGALARADMMARERSLGVIATLEIEQVDIAVAHLLGPRTQLLCNPTEGDRAAALAIAQAQAGISSGVAQGGEARRESESARLARLNEEVARIADTLARLTRGDEGETLSGVRDPGSTYRGPDDAEQPEISAQEIRAVIRSRRLRAQFFAQEMFADPAWDMLLDLFAAELEGRRVSVSSLCIAAAVPPTTALRWIGTLHDAGLFERHADPSDRRRAYIALSQKALEGMRSYVGAVKRAGLGLA
jgi:hypothetical protein